MRFIELQRFLWIKLFRKLLSCPVNVPMFLAEKEIKRGIFVAVDTWTLWHRIPWKNKIWALLRLQWRPSDDDLQREAREILSNEQFGHERDFGPGMFELVRWYQSQGWQIDALTATDEKRADALSTLAVLTRIRLGNARSEPDRRLCLAVRTPILMALPVPMVVKIPLLGFQFFLDVDVHFAFNSIRKANHAHADDLISYLYEILFLQMKVATGIHEYLRLAAVIRAEKMEASLLNAEVDTIMGADLVFSYLKASIEKTVAFTGLVFGIENLDAKKTHAQKMSVLKGIIDDSFKETPYGEYLFHFLSSDGLATLNNFRTGLLHKKGIADLQPHNYVDKDPEALPFLQIYEVLLDQHARNTTVLLSALALLTDQLVLLDKPSMSAEEIVRQCPVYLEKLSALLASAVSEETKPPE